MKISADLFRRAVDVTRLVCDPRATVPVLSHGRLVVVDGTATLTATDLDTWVDVRFPVEGSCETSLLELAPLLKRLPSKGLIELAQDEGSWWIVEGRRRLRAPSFSAPDAWPEHRSDSGVLGDVRHYNGSELRAALEHARPAISDDTSRPTLHNVLFDAVGCVVATDGHRLHWTEGLPVAPDWRVPGAAVVALLAAMRKAGVPDRITLSAFGERTDEKTGHRLGLRFDLAVGDLRISIGCRERVEQFPPWRLVLPKNAHVTATFDAKDMIGELAAFKRAGVGEELSSEVRLSANGPEIVVEVHTYGEIEARTTVPASGPAEMDLTAVFASYLREALAASDGAVSVRREKGATKPLILDLDGSRHAMVMPRVM